MSCGKIPLKLIERLKTFSSVCHAMCEWIPSFFLCKEFSALQLSAPWLMFTQWLIWLFWVMLDKQQLISTISTTSVRCGWALLENNLAPWLESKTEIQKVPCFYAIFDLRLIFSWTLDHMSFSLFSQHPLLPPSFHFIPICALLGILPFTLISLHFPPWLFCLLFKHLRSLRERKCSSHFYKTSN